MTKQSSSFEVVAPRARRVFYLTESTVYATHLDTGATETIAKIPPEWATGSGFALNADETLLAGCVALGAAEIQKTTPRAKWATALFEAKLPNLLYTIDIKSGAVKTIHRGNELLGHLQFSPTDPRLLMFCNEGPWDRVERVWHIRADGTDLHCPRRRTATNEYITHEFWSRDGRVIWYDLQQPRGRQFFLGSTRLGTGESVRYRLPPEAWSYHYTASHDGKFFVGDGGPGGKWIYRFTPQGAELRVERLCSMARHDYVLEPNVMLTPDDRWVVFRSNMDGADQVYAVELASTR